MVSAPKSQQPARPHTVVSQFVMMKMDDQSRLGGGDVTLLAAGVPTKSLHVFLH